MQRDGFFRTASAVDLPESPKVGTARFLFKEQRKRAPRDEPEESGLKQTSSRAGGILEEHGK